MSFACGSIHIIFQMNESSGSTVMSAHFVYLVVGELIKNLSASKNTTKNLKVF